MTALSVLPNSKVSASTKIVSCESFPEALLSVRRSSAVPSGSSASIETRVAVDGRVKSLAGGAKRPWSSSPLFLDAAGGEDIEASRRSRTRRRGWVE